MVHRGYKSLDRGVSRPTSFFSSEEGNAGEKEKPSSFSGRAFANGVSKRVRSESPQAQYPFLSLRRKKVVQSRSLL